MCHLILIMEKYKYGSNMEIEVRKATKNGRKRERKKEKKKACQKYSGLQQQYETVTLEPFMVIYSPEMARLREKHTHHARL